MIKFLWNGLKGSDGKLQKAIYTLKESGSIRALAHGYDYFSDDINAEFVVKNDSLEIFDCLKKDSFEVAPGHRCYEQALAAIKARQERYKRKVEKWKARMQLSSFARQLRFDGPLGAHA